MLRLSTFLEVVVPRKHRFFGQAMKVVVITLTSQLGVSHHAKADDPHLGIIEYEISCMPCHGIDGRGDGPHAKTLKTFPADLTQIAKRNNGEFPYKKIADIIDGRATVAVHGPREMPVWGDRTLAHQLKRMKLPPGLNTECVHRSQPLPSTSNPPAEMTAWLGCHSGRSARCSLISGKLLREHSIRCRTRFSYSD